MPMVITAQVVPEFRSNAIAPAWFRNGSALARRLHFVTRIGFVSCLAEARKAGIGFAFFPYQMERKTPYSNERGSAVWIALTAAVSLAIVTLMATYL